VDCIQNIKKTLKNIITNDIPSTNGPVYLWNEVILAASPEIGHLIDAEIDTKVAKRLAIVCGCAADNKLQIVIAGLNSESGNIPVIMNTIELNTETPAGGCIINDTFPFTRITATNNDTVSAGVITVSYVITNKVI